MQGLLAKWLVAALIPLAKTDFLLARISSCFLLFSNKLDFLEI